MKFAHDTFTDTPLAGFVPGTSGLDVLHVGEIGTTWRRGAGLTGVFRFDSTGNRVRSDNGNSNSYFYSQTAAKGDGTYCEIVYDVVTAVDSIGPVVRAGNTAGYHALITSNAISVRRLETNGNFTTLTFDGGGTSKTIAQAAGSRHTCRITATGTGASVAVEVKFDGVVLGTVTDTSATRITALGSIGFTGFGTFNDATGMHIDSIVGYSAAPAATAFSVVGKTSITKNTAGTFFINPNGDTASTFTVSDNGGGTLSATTVAADGSFTYTPTTSGAKTLTVTSSAGLPTQTVNITVLSVPTGAVTNQPPPSGQSARFIGTTTDATGGTYTLTGSNGGATVGPLPFTVTADAFDFTVTGLQPGTYTPTLTVTGPGGTVNVTGTSAFSIATITGGGELPAAPSADNTAPTITAAAVASSAPGVIVLTASEPLSDIYVPAGSAFTVPGHTVNSVAITGSAINLNVSPDFVAGEAARTVAYAPQASNGARDPAGNLIAAFTGLAVTNNVAAPPSTVTGVTVSPSTVTLAGGAVQQFTASVAGTNSPAQGVTWTRSPAVGTLSPSGQFTAPAPGSSGQTITITATSQQDPNFAGTATVTVPAASTSVDPTFIRSKIRTLKVRAASVSFDAEVPGAYWDLTNPRKPVGRIDPNAEIDISLDWSEVLADITDTIKSVEFDLAGVTSKGGYSANGITTVFVANATAQPRITCRITTNSVPPRIEDRTVFLTIEDQ